MHCATCMTFPIRPFRKSVAWRNPSIQDQKSNQNDERKKESVLHSRIRNTFYQLKMTINKKGIVSDSVVLWLIFPCESHLNFKFNVQWTQATSLPQWDRQVLPQKKTEVSTLLHKWVQPQPRLGTLETAPGLVPPKLMSHCGNDSNL